MQNTQIDETQTEIMKNLKFRLFKKKKFNVVVLYLGVQICWYSENYFHAWRDFSFCAFE